jgi:cellulose biosynthesis protein BcsQ
VNSRLNSSAKSSSTAPARTIVVAGGGGIRTTLATNLAAAFASLSADVALLDQHPACPALRALGVGDDELPRARDGMFVALPGWGGAERVFVHATDRGRDASHKQSMVVVHASRADEALAGGADLLLVPMDASPSAWDALRALRALAGGHALRVVLTRVLPRSTDRWALLETLAELAPNALCRATVPMAQRAVRLSASRPPRGAPLYSPVSRAAHAYRALALELSSAWIPLGSTSRERDAFSAAGNVLPSAAV